MTHWLYRGDCLSAFSALRRGEPAACLFADPPDNIGLAYDEFSDKRTDESYVQFLHELVFRSVSVARICWFSFNARWTFEMGRIFENVIAAHRNGDVKLVGKPCVQVFTFGQHNKNDLGNNHRPLWRLKWEDAPLYPDAIKVPSWRERNGDKRAKPGGRVPGDVLDMQYPVDAEMAQDVDLADTFYRTLSGRVADWPQLRPLLGRLVQDYHDPRSGDVMDFPRVTGNSKQRCDWHPTQLHEELVKRCLLLSTKPGDRVIDPFGGTGTTLRVCRAINRECTLIELDSGYCEKIAAANDLVDQGGGLWCSS